MIAMLGAIGFLAYGIREMGTATLLSQEAPLGWRLRLLLLEGGVPLLVALGCGCAAWGPPRLRRLGWGLVALTLLGLILWTRALLPSAHVAVGGGLALPTVSTLALAAVVDAATRAPRIEAAYRQHAAALVAYAQALNTHPVADIAEDAVHDIFAALLVGHRDDVLERDAAGLRAHLFSAVKHRVETICRSERRRGKRTQRLAAEAADGVTPPPVPTPDVQYARTHQEQRLRAELRRCPKRGAEAFHLVHECGLSYAEAAAVMQITPQGVGAHLSRTIRLLRTRLRDLRDDGGNGDDPQPRRPLTEGVRT